MPRNESGFATVLTTVILAVTFAAAVAFADSVLSRQFALRTYTAASSAHQIAEAGVHKAIFCLNSTDTAKCGGTAGPSYAGESNVTFGGGTFAVTVVTNGANRTITSVGTSPTGTTKTIVTDATSVPPEDAIGFSYALQAGGGGVYMANNSSIEGTIYANGDVICQSQNAGLDGDAYSSKDGGKVQNCSVGFHAHADKILGADVGGNAYYENHPADISGTTVDGTSYPGSSTPDVADMPAIDLNFWRDAAEAGGVIYGNYSPADNSTLGPVKIVGNLTMNNNVDVTVGGPVWVVGDITAGNNVSFTLDPDFGSYSTTILADNPSDSTDGKITLTNNVAVNGSGDPRGHILFASTRVSTTDTDPAISVANNASGAVFYAVNGTLRLQNNGGAKSLAGYRLYLDENAIVTYLESDFTGSFSSSPGGIWRVDAGTWREF